MSLISINEEMSTAEPLKITALRGCRENASRRSLVAAEIDPIAEGRLYLTAMACFFSGSMGEERGDDTDEFV